MPWKMLVSMLSSSLGALIVDAVEFLSRAFLIETRSHDHMISRHKTPSCWSTLRTVVLAALLSFAVGLLKHINPHSYERDVPSLVCACACACISSRVVKISAEIEQGDGLPGLLEGLM